MKFCFVEGRQLMLVVGVFLISMLHFGTISERLMAQSDCGKDVDSTLIIDSIELAPAIRAHASSSTQVFYQNHITIKYQPGQQIILSSSADGQGMLSTDDLIRVQLQPSKKEWENDFRNAARTQIVPIPPQDISALLTPGINTVTLTAIDLLGPEYSSRPYFLVVLNTCVAPTPTVTETATYIRVPTSTSSPIPPTPIPTIAPTFTSQPTATYTPSSKAPTATPTATILAVAQEPRCCAWPEYLYSRGITPSFGIGFLIGFGFIICLLWLWASRPRLTGAIESTDMDTGATQTTSLEQFGSSATAGSDGQIRLNGQDVPAIAGRLIAQRTDQGIRTFWQPEATVAGNAELAIEELSHQSVIEIGRFRLVYQNFTEAAIQSESLEGGIWHEI
ncbi:MAG: hypothetical protein R3A44_06210 [Caldilineaceae bacterium]